MEAVVGLASPGTMVRCTMELIPRPFPKHRCNTLYLHLRTPKLFGGIIAFLSLTHERGSPEKIC